MTLEKLLNELMDREGKKKQINRAQMKEILGVKCDILYEDYVSHQQKAEGGKANDFFPPIYSLMIKNGQARKRRRDRAISKS